MPVTDIKTILKNGENTKIETVYLDEYGGLAEDAKVYLSNLRTKCEIAESNKNWHPSKSTIYFPRYPKHC